MPKFIITERIPATLVYTYEVEADNETEALEQVLSGDGNDIGFNTENRDYEKTEYNIEEAKY
jgi:hypothetical protein